MIDFNAVRAIQDEAEYETALLAVRPYFEHEPEPGTDAAARFEGLAQLIEAYEAKRYPIPMPRPLEALTFRMEQGGHTQADLAHLLGSRSRASEILTGKRDLTLDQIRKLHKAWGIPTASLVGELEDA
jgi:HTH-type transcriptional regulator / antitoxin HigA